MKIDCDKDGFISYVDSYVLLNEFLFIIIKSSSSIEHDLTSLQKQEEEYNQI